MVEQGNLHDSIAYMRKRKTTELVKYKWTRAVMQCRYFFGRERERARERAREREQEQER